MASFFASNKCSTDPSYLLYQIDNLQNQINSAWDQMTHYPDSYHKELTKMIRDMEKQIKKLQKEYNRAVR